MIPWDEPIEVTVVQEDGRLRRVLACRFCIAEVGLKAAEILDPAMEGLAAWETPGGFLEHLVTQHGG
jgi:hypothetical protein